MLNKWPVSNLIMLRPEAFGFNPENRDNHFAQQLAGDFQEQALKEFEGVLLHLRQLGLDLLVLDDQSHSPDAVFLNNWCSLHADGQMVFYPLKSPLRRRELQRDLPQRLSQAGFEVGTLIDWSDWVEQGQFLEGTGSLVLDPVHHKVYAALSERTDVIGVQHFARHFEYEPICFHTLLATETGGPPAQNEALPAYHTNVVLAIGLGFVFWCPEALPFAAERDCLKQHFETDGLERIDLTLAQIAAFAGNVLQVQTASGPCLLMSETAYQSLDSGQIQQIEAYTAIQSLAIPTIEQIGGGSLRCMLLENALPRQNEVSLLTQL